MKKVLILLLVAAVALCGACKATVPSESETESSPSEASTPSPERTGDIMGETTETGYRNTLLGFSATVPDGWYILTAEELSQYIGATEEVISDNALLPESEISLFFCAKSNPNEATTTLANVSLILSSKEEVRQSLLSEEYFADTLESLKSMLLETYPGTEAQAEGEFSTDVNSRTFGAFLFDVNYEGIDMYLDQYFTDLGDYSLTVTMTYFNEAEKQKAYTFLDSLKFE